MKKILVSLSIIAAVAAVIVGATTAYFSDTETSTGNTLTAGTLDLYVNGQNPLEGPVVTLSDLKPSIPQYVEKSFKVVDNPANVWLHITDVECDGGVLLDGLVVHYRLLLIVDSLLLNQLILSLTVYTVI